MVFARCAHWIAVVLFAAAVARLEDDLHVTVSTGTLRGKMLKTSKGQAFLAFLKIPYAAPPLGALRFKAPEDPSPWLGVRDATKDADICTQRNIFVKKRFFLKGQEDCLYLNVYTPRVNASERVASTPGLAVMVWFHGGGFVTGSGNSEYYPPHYLMDKNVILVTLNYRLGPMGFLSMEDEVMPGNWGLKDQSKALQWIHRNIAQFGGDPGAITIFGESAGGVSVHYHMMSPMSKGLFHRGISQSGTPFSAWALSYPGVTRNNTIKMAELVACPTHTSQALVSCMRDKPVQDIILQDVHFMEWYRDPMIPFKPVIEKLARPEDAFLPDDPANIISRGEVADIPWMTGLNSADGALRVAAIYDDYKLVQELDRKFDDIVPMSLFYRDHKNVTKMTQELRKFYLGERRVDNDTLSSVVDIWTDGWFLAGAEQAVHLMTQVNKSPVYYYYFTYRGTASFSSVFGESSIDFGVCHADELIYLFPFDGYFPANEYTEEDNRYRELLLQMWTDFAKTGDPTPQSPSNRSVTVPVRWEPVSTAQHEYLHLGSLHAITMEKKLLNERVRFWERLMSQDMKRGSSIRDEL